MRVTWSSSESRFEVILPYDLRDELSLLQKAKFKTTGPPNWIWYTQKASSLNKLRKLEPKSGVEITELALDKYKFLNENETKNLEVKKQFKKLQQSLGQFRFDEYFDQELQVTCFVVKPPDEPFVWDYRPPAPPTVLCLECDSPMYFPFDDKAYCVWCEITLDKISRL